MRFADLPGIGRYTVGAIASMAFGMDEPTLDGNIRRVFARVFDISLPADSSSGEKALWDLAAEHLPKGKAGDYNQALMDLGATICLPKNPRCLICPLMELCEARRKGIQDQRPVLKLKKKTPHYILAAAVIVKNGRVLLAKRPSKGLLGGMWEFPNGRVEDDPAKELSKNLRSGYQLKVQRDDALGVVKHAYTHFKVTVHVFQCKLVSMIRKSKHEMGETKELGRFSDGESRSANYQIIALTHFERIKGLRYARLMVTKIIGLRLVSSCR